jgi:hypothetical protein
VRLRQADRGAAGGVPVLQGVPGRALPAAGPSRWAQRVDVKIARQVTEFLLPGLACPCCGEVTFPPAPPGLHPGAVSYGPVRLRLLLALASRRKGSVAAGVPEGFVAGYLMTDGYTGYQHLLARIAGIGQCGQHVIRRARQVRLRPRRLAARLQGTGLSSCSLATLAWPSPATSASAVPRPPSATRPSPAIRSYLDPAARHGRHRTRRPSPPPSRKTPGYRHSQPPADPHSQQPVNGHPGLG